ncbi:MAG TPA: hypothetical protein VN628_07005 [Vicinamibacterales bacterium]|nr:hypothetical protein [Vicinamibacterales bacterium]
MPIKFDTDHAARRMLVTASQPFTEDDVNAYIDARFERGAWVYSVIIDLRELSDWMPSVQVVKAFMERLGSFGETFKERGPVAFVVNHSDPALYGMIRMYSIMADMRRHPRVDVFYAIENAVAWLDQQ